MPPERRRQLHGWVSPQSLAGWQKFADEQGANVTALLEVMGLKLAELAAESRLPSDWRRLVQQAQSVAGTRSSRVGRRGEGSGSHH